MLIPKESVGRSKVWIGLGVAAVVVLLGFWGLRGRLSGVDPNLVWREAEANFSRGRYERVEAGLSELARLRAPDPLDWMLKAQMALVRKKDDLALADLEHIPDLHPMAAQARLLSGQIELRRSRLRFAEKSLLEACRLDPTLVQSHRELIYIYGILLRRTELSDQFRRLGELAPLTYENVFHWCLTRNTVWEPKELVVLLTKALGADPEDRWSRLSLAENLRQLGRRDEAEEVLSPLAASDPEARAVRVRIAFDRGDDQGAEALLAGGPADHAELSRFRGRLALAHRDGAAAVKQFRAAYAKEPDNRDAIFGLGQALAMAGENEAAAPLMALSKSYDALGTLMQRASNTKARNDADLMRSLGAACEQVGRLPEARAWYSLAINANALDAESQKALFRLKAEETAGKPKEGESKARNGLTRSGAGG